MAKHGIDPRDREVRALALAYLRCVDEDEVEACGREGQRLVEHSKTLRRAIKALRNLMSFEPDPRHDAHEDAHRPYAARSREQSLKLSDVIARLEERRAALEGPDQALDRVGSYAAATAEATRVVLWFGQAFDKRNNRQRWTPRTIALALMSWGLVSGDEEQVTDRLRRVLERDAAELAKLLALPKAASSLDASPSTTLNEIGWFDSDK
jgi:hypothetical protein